MDVALSAPQEAYNYHADVIYLLPKLGIKMGASWGLWLLLLRPEGLY